MLVSAPILYLFPGESWARIVGWLSDLMAIVAIAIGVGGSIAMGVFQVADGIDVLMGGDGAGPWLVGIVFLVMVASYIPPLLMDLGSGMSRLSNLAMAIALSLVVFTVVLGPTEFLLNSVLGGFGQYLTEAIPRGFQTFTFFDDTVGAWPVHGLCGVWGCLAIGILPNTHLAAGSTSLGTQVTGTLAICGWSFATMLGLFAALLFGSNLPPALAEGGLALVVILLAKEMLKPADRRRQLLGLSLVAGKALARIGRRPSTANPPDTPK